MIRIFHTGDIHLDSAFQRLKREDRLRARQHQRDIFLKMIKYVSDNGFDLMLISGDLFDGRNISPETEECVVDAFSSLDCPVVISPGNHDPYLLTAPYFKGRLPENVYVFNSEELQVFELEELGVRVCGYAFMSSNTYDRDPLENFELPMYDGITLLCAHTELNVRNSRFAPIFESDIAERGVTYAALGHVHSAQIIKRENTTIAYCGVLEGRAFDEVGDCGALAVTVDEQRRVLVERVLLGEHKFMLDSFDITDIDDISSLIERLQGYIGDRYEKDVSLRITLCGETELDIASNKATVEKLLAGALADIEVIDDSYPKIDVKQLETDFTLRGEVYRVLRAELEGESGEARRMAAEALKVALLAIDGREIR